MRQRLPRHLTYANVMATIAVFLALGLGGAWAATELGKNDVKSKHIKNRGVKTKDLADNAVTSPKVANASLLDEDFAPGELPQGPQGEQGPPGPTTGPAGGDLTGNYPDPAIAASAVGGAEVSNDSLTGTDINESSLGEVPSATLGGLGGDSATGAGCDPESLAIITCTSGSIDVPASSRVLIIGQIRAEPDTGGGNGGGHCGVAANAGIEGLVPVFVNGGQTDVMAMSAVTPPVGPGTVTLSIECNETASGIRFFNPRLSFVALSPGF